MTSATITPLVEPAAPTGDGALLAQARTGDFAAFEALLARHQDRLHGTVWHILRHQHDVQDVIQQTMLSAIEHLDEFRGEAAFGTWLLRIGTNHALQLLRRRRTRPEVTWTDASSAAEAGEEPASEGPLPHPDFIAPWRQRPDQALQQQDTRASIEQALDELDEKYRVVFVLRDVNEFSIAETARLLGLTEGTVKIRLLRARLMLRERLTRLLGDPHQRLEHPNHEHA
jgi:RNA polymerase sigma-70 factor, ECF subfamily